VNYSWAEAARGTAKGGERLTKLQIGNRLDQRPEGEEKPLFRKRKEGVVLTEKERGGAAEG